MKTTIKEIKRAKVWIFARWIISVVGAIRTMESMGSLARELHGSCLLLLLSNEADHTFEAKLRNASTLLRLGITSKLVLLSP